MESATAAPAALLLRTDLSPGDLGGIVALHGTVYARDYGFDITFEAYVAGPLAEAVLSASAGTRLWVAERGGRVVGSVAVVAAGPGVGQLRWFLVEPGARGSGLGRRLLHEALAFCRECGHDSVFLWTVSALTAAAHPYRAAGFRKVEERPGRRWGVDVIEEKYELHTPQGE
jgi:GNAT superfamily N-acetyltransferase